MNLLALNTSLLTFVALCTGIVGCSKNEPSSAPPSSSLESTAKVAQSALASTKATPAEENGNTYREQGTMKVDAGQGVQLLHSMATLIDPKLGEKTAAKIGTASGQKKLADATAGSPQVTAGDIQDTANTFAGRTMYSSQAMHVKIINSYGIELDAKSKAADGVRMKLVLTVLDKDLKLQNAKLEYFPNASNRMQSYEKKIPISDVQIDKLERKDDKTFVISGSFKGTDLPAGVLAKDLKGKTLPTVSGQFDFAEVNIRG